MSLLMLSAGGRGAVILVYVVSFLMMFFMLWCACRISGKLGHSPWMGLLILLPLVWPLFMAFAEAPNEKLARRYKKEKRKTKRSGGGSSPRTGSAASAWATTPEDRAAEALDDLFG
ncbi:MAG: hypothetical protein R3236_03340 [Phycisphaeraceae bacterium]|nr:hypothetical protein [Phycisphaeraceae bacterium]